MKNLYSLKRISLILVCIAAMLLAGCGGANGSNTGEDGQTESTRRRGENVPTMPAANFTSVGAQSGLTETTSLATPEPTAAEGPDLTLGERVYTNRCAECHGAAAEGGSASALAGLTMDESTFEDLLRTGGNIGPSHLFGTRAVSENGLFAIHAWLQSLSD